MNQDTIAAIATPPGEGAIAIIRVSGSQAFSIAEKIFSRPTHLFKSHTAHYGHILKPDGTRLDSVLLLLMKGPHSYTGEDSIEISCHGGSLITQKVLERVLQAGARPAHPGEFSMRAFLNGKIDLAQAEAVQELIGAKNELALENAEKQLQGALSEQIAQFQKELTDIAAILEAWVDFPEEDLAFAPMEEILARLKGLCSQMKKLQATFHEGKILHEGLTLCLLGSPNVGKSSLMNALLGKERAIVTEIPGTTRDLLEEDLRIGKLHFKLIDTAGIRDTEERIEREGIRRSQSAMQEADLILLLLDASRPLDHKDQELLTQAPPHKTLVIWNKVDVAHPTDDFPALLISAKEKKGLDALKAAIEEKIWKKGAPSKEEIFLTKLRHYQALSEAIQGCETAISGLQQNVSAEFVTSDIRSSLIQLHHIVGGHATETLLSAIFSRFCLGK